MAKSIFIDTTRCTACRGCQVACKQWHDHEAVPTLQTGTHQNPPDLTPHNFKLVRFSEHKIDGRVHWLFFPEQCRHCLQPACKATADNFVEGAIVIDEATGIVICTEKTKELTKEQCDEIVDSCPYNIPRRNEKTKELTKCDMCIDRVHAGLIPMCVKTCVAAMSFGEREDMLKKAEEHLERVKKTFPQAELLDVEDLGVIYLVSHPREMYHKYAQREVRPLNRADFLADLTRPFRSVLG
ncbi:formate dehydrogenase 2 subunit beta (cytochrome c-553) [Desulfovibrionales bacterium]